ncbi:signal transduction histidine kinase [Actinoplanes octamycinicus]|uniref:histidine kinase n=1 Tax=Actinoplanes octamycinicus TaxID=135948 RepID=A0A7W7H1R2_9ACTN|nr:ATP-binding protein [Actinoplanes octamycinicus]MBB4742401.1 signal transduction histidine kinase [Actinoplanes octamycinicus]GIE62349.1 hypothetical protein Aoc01nite_77510 [Actinoplanes octamycinicus]
MNRRRLVAAVAVLTAIGADLWLGVCYATGPWPLVASEITLGGCCAITGLVLWSAVRSRRRAGGLLTLFGLVVLVGAPYCFGLSAAAPGGTLARLLGEPAYWLRYAVAGHLLLSCPSFRLARHSAESVVVRSGYALVPITLLRPEIWPAWLLFTAVAAGTLARRFALASPGRRHDEAFVVPAAVVASALYTGMLVTGPNTVLTGAALAAVTAAFLGGLLGRRLAFASVGRAVRRLGAVPADRVERALAEALHDPGLRVVFPTPAGRLDVAGAPFRPADDRRRAETPLGAEPRAILVHDPVLAEHRDLLASASAAARLALDNARLHAELRAKLAEGRASRLRIAVATDRERRRLEDDLRHGPRRRLREIERRLGDLLPLLPDDRDRTRVRHLQEAVRDGIGELDRLGRGLLPEVLTTRGLGPALREMARWAPGEVHLDVRLPDRLDPLLEATAYYVVSEGLQNVTKHTGRRAARVRAVREDAALVVTVADDGPGGARVDGGTGLRGLADRVAAVGGRLTVDSPPGGGTVLRADLPVAVGPAES